MEAMGFNRSGFEVDGFDFERNFDEKAFLGWMDAYWTSAFWYAAVYVVLIFAGRRYMADRPRFELRWALVLWSGFLAVFSVCGAARTVPELVYVTWVHSFQYSVCIPSYFYGPTAFWAYAFVISKVYELGDTAFIILRKQPLIFLHWYHHITVMIYVWYSYTDHTAPGRWFTSMNYAVHSFMYTYYMIRALRFRIPRFVSVFITSIQIAQMVMGLVVNCWSYFYKSQGIYCQQSYENMRYSTIMYISYFCLFAYFFYGAYLKAKPKPHNNTQKPELNGKTQNTKVHGDHNDVANGKKIQ